MYYIFFCDFHLVIRFIYLSTLEKQLDPDVRSTKSVNSGKRIYLGSFDDFTFENPWLPDMSLALF